MYDDTHVSQLKFILKAKALGFTLDEVASLMWTPPLSTTLLAS